MIAPDLKTLAGLDRADGDISTRDIVKANKSRTCESNFNQPIIRNFLCKKGTRRPLTIHEARSRLEEIRQAINPPMPVKELPLLSSANRLGVLLAILVQSGGADQENAIALYNIFAQAREQVRAFLSENPDTTAQQKLTAIYEAILDSDPEILAVWQDFIPVLAKAIAHEEGFPVSLVEAKGVFFARWDDSSGTRFNMVLVPQSFGVIKEGEFVPQAGHFKADVLTDQQYTQWVGEEGVRGDFGHTLNFAEEIAYYYASFGRVIKDRTPGHQREALSHYFQATYWNPKYSGYYLDLGAAHLYNSMLTATGREQELNKAAEYLSKAITLNPKDAQAYFLMAQLMVSDQEPGRALLMASIAVDLRCGDPEAYYLLARLNIDQKDAGGAAKALRPLLDAGYESQVRQFVLAIQDDNIRWSVLRSLGVSR